MEDRQHQQIARWERAWLAVSGLMTLMFVLLIAYNLAVEGTHIAQRTDKATPEQILAQDLFAEPGVRVAGPGRVQVTSVAQAFSFQPADIRVPVGSEVEFYLTSRDVIHGFQVEKTNINVEVIPGEVSRLHYTFREPGTYRVTCNEYCGTGHHDMLGTVTVVPASQWRAQAEEAAPADDEADGGLDGAEVYADNCASCHQAEGQGVPGAFPPLAGHSADLLDTQGRDYLPLVLLYGLEGGIEVEGASYDGAMPAWGQLSDEALAAVSNYLLEDLSADALPEDFEPYAASEFAEARGQDLSASDVHARRTE